MYFLSLLVLLKNNKMVTLANFNVSLRMRELMNVTMIQVFEDCIVLETSKCSYTSKRMSKEETLILHDQLLNLVNDIDQIKHFIL